MTEAEDAINYTKFRQLASYLLTDHDVPEGTIQAVMNDLDREVDEAIEEFVSISDGRVNVAGTNELIELAQARFLDRTPRTLRSADRFQLQPELAYAEHSGIQLTAQGLHLECTPEMLSLAEAKGGLATEAVVPIPSVEAIYGVELDEHAKLTVTIDPTEDITDAD